MIISVWRYSHLVLAISSFLLLTLASLSGIVLAFEPVIEKAKSYKIDDFDRVTLSQTVPVLKEKIHGIQQLMVDDNDFVIVKYADKEGNDKKSYINPVTGAILGTPQKQAPLFEWMTALHRSLFLHESGRLMVGIATFLLILIALSGVALVIKRQKGIWRFFAPVEKTGFAQYYHVVFGRLSLVFILALALTGTYLSVSRFIIKPAIISAIVKEEDIKEEPKKNTANFRLFQKTMLSQVETIQFPFSDFPEDYFTIKLKDREVCVNQLTGDILAQQVYPKSYVLTAFSLRWHTGRSNAVWAIIMAITSAYMLFFIYSGFTITWKRLRNRSKNKFKVGDCRIIILVGSENGSTFQFARSVYLQLLKHGEKVYLTDLDNYSLFPKAEHLIVMTSTYGEGDPPSNAKKFAARLTAVPQQQTVQFSVVGFGSRNYQQFCKFAYHTDHLLRQQPWALPVSDVVTVDDRSLQDFSNWLTAWTKHTNFPLMMPRELIRHDKQGLQKLAVTYKTDTAIDRAFMIRLKAKRFTKVVSGDLLAIYPKNDHRERLYSIGKVDNKIQLSVQLHEHGLGSHFLNALQIEDAIEGRIIKNQHFHFPKHASQVVMISNGTGIAPFLGMISENKKKVSCNLYCGFRTQAAFELYQPFLSENMATGNIEAFHPALSREIDGQYVSHLIQKDEDAIWQVLANNGLLMICGSLSMQKDVFAVLENICIKKGGYGLAVYQEKGQVLTDCY
ncbi:MAG: PepSY domain-containing protein [Ferruginibacter sp.]